jgi:transcriptional regulator with XRE-family HTH domain
MTDVLALGIIPEFEIGDRMRKALQKSGMTSLDMAEYLGVSQASVSNWINNRHEPTKQTVMLWALKTGIPFEWIATGCTPRDLNPEPTDSGSSWLASVIDLPSPLRAVAA